MKTKLFLCLLSISVLLISCKKDVSYEVQDNRTKQISDQELVQKVKEFINQAHDAKAGRILKDSEKLPIDEAIDFIDESFSYEYCHHQANIKDIKTVSISIKIPIISLEEKVYLVNALLAYNEAVAKIRVKYNDDAEKQKVLYGVSVINKGVDNSGDYIDVDIIGKIGIGTLNTSPSDGWYWAQQSHSCDELILGMGAPEIIESEVTFGLNPVPTPNTRIWFTDEPEYPLDEITPNQTRYRASNPIDNFCDYYMFYAAGSNLDPYKCLEENNGELSFYCYSASSVFAILLSDYEQYSGYSCKNLQITDAEYTNPVHSINHEYHFFIGIKHISTISSSDPYPINISIDE